MEYKNNWSLTHQIPTKNLTFKDVWSHHKPAIFITSSICVKIFNYFLSSIKSKPSNIHTHTHSCSRKCTYTCHSKCVVSKLQSHIGKPTKQTQ